MKTAVLLSGQMRTFSICLASLKWCVFRKLEDPAFFVSCADDADAESAELLRTEFPDAIVEIEVVKQPDLPEPDAILTRHAPYTISSSVQAILRQLWHMSRVWKFAAGKGALAAHSFVRCRPDLHFHLFRSPIERPPYSIIERRIEAPVAWTPWWGEYGGINDRFAMLGKEAAPHYFEAYDKLPALIAKGCPIHPESIVAASLEHGGALIQRYLCAEFGALRPNGEFIHMRPTPQEIARYAAALCLQH